MKKPLPPQVIYGIVGVVVVAIAVAAYLMFKPADAGPPVVATPFSPSFGDKGTPSSGGSAPGAPKPDTTGASTTGTTSMPNSAGGAGSRMGASASAGG